MTAAMVTLIMTMVVAVVFFVSGGKDRLRMVVAALWGVTLGASYGAAVTGFLIELFTAIGGMFGA
jgi:hypothetical protein